MLAPHISVSWRETARGLELYFVGIVAGCDIERQKKRRRKREN
jgi:hypothetical protein